MPKIVLERGDEKLEADWTDGEWTVRQGERVVTARYLDYALAELGLDSAQAHALATKIVEEMPAGD